LEGLAMSEVSRKRKWVHGRSAHRQRSDDEAHAGAASSPLPPILQHPLVAQGEPTLIQTQADLDQHLRDLRAAGRFAYDTEFIGEHTYHAKLCVVQTATSTHVAIIDPLAQDLNLRGMWELLADGSVEKIVHAGEQDLEPILRHVNKPPANVFDTQVVAAFAGLGYPVGMAKMVRELLGADPGAGLTFSQWDRRPLSRMQTLYAANDVRYLPLLRETLVERAKAANNLEWALDECAALCAEERYRADPNSQRLRVRGSEALSLRELTVLSELIAWRERAAQEADLPPKALLRDGILMDMTYNPVLTVAELDRVSGLPRPVEQRWGPDIVAAIKIGIETPLCNGAKPVLFDRWKHRRLVDKLWETAASSCVTRGVDPAIAVSKRELGHYLRAMELGGDREAAAGRLLRGWRRELFSAIIA
jgi:ribonuclease D